MKRIAAAILAALMLAAGAAATVSAAAKVDGRPTAEAYLVDKIEIDGKIDDAWQYAPKYNVEKVKTASDASYYKSTMKPGNDYATMTFKVLWDGTKTLYILAEVFDITPNYTGDKDWYKDSMEFFYNKDNSNVAGTKKTSQHRLLADGSNAGSQKHPAAVAKTKTGYVVEYALDISNSTPVSGGYIGLDFQLNDNILNNGGAAEVYLGWSDGTNKASSDASVYGQCLLSAKKIADVKAAALAAQTTAATTKAPAAAGSSAATFDAAVILAVVAAAAGAGTVVSRKRK